MSTVISITRIIKTETQSLGVLNAVRSDKSGIFICETLELAYKNNQPMISCIPTGTYNYSFYNSPTKGKVVLIKNVPNRAFIEIHAGNFYTQINGCILVGSKGFLDLNNDDQLDVLSSRQTLSDLLDFIEPHGVINIY